MTRANTCNGLLAKALRFAGDILLPPRCLGCGVALVDHAQLCPACWHGIVFASDPVQGRLCIEAGRAISIETAGFRHEAFVCAYTGVARELVHGLKYAERFEAARFMSAQMARTGAWLLADAQLLVPVPLNKWRYRIRKFNQAALLAKLVADGCEVPVCHDALVRVRATRSQVGLTAGQRRRNVGGAFRVPEHRKADVFGRSVVLVDDVITTGSTMEACARTLLRAGARSVDLLAFARVREDLVPGTTGDLPAAIGPFDKS